MLQGLSRLRARRGVGEPWRNLEHSCVIDIVLGAAVGGNDQSSTEIRVNRGTYSTKEPHTAVRLQPSNSTAIVRVMDRKGGRGRGHTLRCFQVPECVRMSCGGDHRELRTIPSDSHHRTWLCGNTGAEWPEMQILKEKPGIQNGEISQFLSVDN